MPDIKIENNVSLENLSTIKPDQPHSSSLAGREVSTLGSAELQKAIDQNQLDRIKELLEKHKELLKTPLPNGYLPLAFEIYLHRKKGVDDPIVNLMIDMGADLEQRDADQCSAFDYAILSGNRELADKILSILTEKKISQFGKEQEELKETIKAVEQVGIPQLIQVVKHLIKTLDQQSLATLAEQGTSQEEIEKLVSQKSADIIQQTIKAGYYPLSNAQGKHNHHLLSAIENHNSKLFIRLALDGASLLSSDQNVSLLDIAAFYGEEEIVAFLLKYGFEKEELFIKSADQFAEKKNRKNVVELLSQWTKEPKSPKIKKLLAKLDKIETECKQEHAALSPEWQALRKKVALYGTLGHHPLLLEALATDNLAQFVEAHQLGAPLDTYEINRDQLDSNPNSLWAKVKKEYDAGIEGRETAIGRSLLHTATTAGATKIVRYLLLQRLQHNEADSKGQWPEEIAYKNGDLEAGLLLQSRGREDNAKAILQNPQRMKQIAALLAKASHSRDPLGFDGEEAFSALLSLFRLTQQTGILTTLFGGDYSSMLRSLLLWTTIGYVAYTAIYPPQEKKQSTQPYVLTGRMASLSRFLGRGYLAEMFLNPRYPILSLGSQAFSINRHVREIFSSYKTYKKHLSMRPLSTIRLIAFPLLNTLTSITYFGSLFHTGLTSAFEDASRTSPHCTPADPPEAYLNHPDFNNNLLTGTENITGANVTELAQLARRFSPDAFQGLKPLDPQCPEHASILLRDWKLCTDKLSTTRCDPGNIYRTLALATYKSGIKDSLRTLNDARRTLQMQPWLTPLKAEMVKTSLIAGGVFLFNYLPFASKVWQNVGNFLLLYQLSMGIGSALFGQRED